MFSFTGMYRTLGAVVFIMLVFPSKGSAADPDMVSCIKLSYSLQSRRKYICILFVSQKAVEDLIKGASTLGAPFADSAVAKLRGELFGKVRATETTDVVIFNLQSCSFRLYSTFCQSGRFSVPPTSSESNLMPYNVHSAQKREKSFFNGIESVDSGVECNVIYEEAIN